MVSPVWANRLNRTLVRFSFVDVFTLPVVPGVPRLQVATATAKVVLLTVGRCKCSAKFGAVWQRTSFICQSTTRRMHAV